MDGPLWLILPFLKYGDNLLYHPHLPIVVDNEWSEYSLSTKISMNMYQKVSATAYRAHVIVCNSRLKPRKMNSRAAYYLR